MPLSIRISSDASAIVLYLRLTLLIAFLLPSCLLFFATRPDSSSSWDWSSESLSSRENETACLVDEEGSIRSRSLDSSLSDVFKWR